MTTSRPAVTAAGVATMVVAVFAAPLVATVMLCAFAIPATWATRFLRPPAAAPEKVDSPVGAAGSGLSAPELGLLGVQA
jgi:hypothetical protein